MAVTLDAGAVAEQALFYRLRDDADRAAMLGSGTRVFAGWPDDTMQAGDFPRVTLTVPVDALEVPGYHRLRVQLDAWVWPTGPLGGRYHLLLLASWLNALLAAQTWAYDGVRISSAPLPGTRVPAGDRLLRHTARYDVGAN